MLSFPEPAEPASCTLLFVPTELIPIVGGLFRRMEQRRRWLTDDDFEQGYRAFTDLQYQLMNSCLAELIQEIRDLRGVIPEHESVPVAERTSDMYRSIGDLIEHVNTVIFALSGGLTHGDNVLTILRGTDEATEDRNLLDMLE